MAAWHQQQKEEGAGGVASISGQLVIDEPGNADGIVARLLRAARD